MIKVNEDDSFKLRTGDLAEFLEVILEQAKTYSEFKHNRPKIEELNDGEAICRLNRQQLDPLYISSVFAAFFLEAYIFDYGARKKSDGYIEKYIDKLDPPSKWVVVTALFNERGLEPSDSWYHHMTTIFKDRNKLAHSRSKNFVPDQISKADHLKPPDERLASIECIMKALLDVDPNEQFALIVVDRIETVRKLYPA